MANKSATRLFVILAKEARVGVIFRRGPSKLVNLIKWDTSKDFFEYGQWFKGRIYERACDLSPSGDKLIYYAAKWGRKPIETETWTAISKPPYLTALVLWTNLGPAAGGGLFEDDWTIRLNHPSYPGLGQLGEGSNLPAGIRIKYLEEFSERVEYDNSHHERLLRDGWKLIEKGKKIEHPYDPSSKIWITFDPSITYQKIKKDFILTMQIKGIHEWGGPNYVIEYAMEKHDDKKFSTLGRMDWADWDKNGDLLFAKDGKLFRLRVTSNSIFDLKEAIELADFNHLKFEEKVAPKKALKWY
jgi:hypothetical protein